MRSQWNGNDDLTCFKGLVGRRSANSRRACCVGACSLLNKQGSACDGADLEFGFRGCLCAAWPGFGERAGSLIGEAQGDSCLLSCLLSVRPTSDGSSQREGELSALLILPSQRPRPHVEHPGCASALLILPSQHPSTAAPGASRVCVYLAYSPFPASTAAPAASRVCGEYELLERKGPTQHCSRVTLGKFLIIFSIGSRIPE